MTISEKKEIRKYYSIFVLEGRVSLSKFIVLSFVRVHIVL